MQPCCSHSPPTQPGPNRIQREAEHGVMTAGHRLWEEPVLCSTASGSKGTSSPRTTFEEKAGGVSSPLAHFIEFLQTTGRKTRMNKVKNSSGFCSRLLEKRTSSSSPPGHVELYVTSGKPKHLNKTSETSTCASSA